VLKRRLAGARRRQYQDGMRFPAPLVTGTLVRRYKRFLADVILDDGTAVTAACPNTGSMMGLAMPGLRVHLSISDSPARKYRHTWELVEVDGALVGINTGHPNRLAEEAIMAGVVGELAGHRELKREVKYGRNSRGDILLSGEDGRHTYVEVKNVHLSRSCGLAEFPDAVTARGARHLDELAAMAAQGHRAVMLFLVQRSDAERFALARDIDPTYAIAFERARAAGVEMLAYACRLSPQEIVVDRALPIAA